MIREEIYNGLGRLIANVSFTMADIMSDGQEVEHVRRAKFDLDGGQMWCVHPNVRVSLP